MGCLVSPSSSREQCARLEGNMYKRTIGSVRRIFRLSKEAFLQTDGENEIPSCISIKACFFPMSSFAICVTIRRIWFLGVNGSIRYACWSFFLMADYFSHFCLRDFSLKLMDYILMRNESCPRWLTDLLRVSFVAPCRLCSRS